MRSHRPSFALLRAPASRFQDLETALRRAGAEYAAFIVRDGRGSPAEVAVVATANPYGWRGRDLSRAEAVGELQVWGNGRHPADMVHSAGWGQVALQLAPSHRDLTTGPAVSELRAVPERPGFTGRPKFDIET